MFQDQVGQNPFPKQLQSFTYNYFVFCISTLGELPDTLHINQFPQKMLSGYSISTHSKIFTHCIRSSCVHKSPIQYLQVNEREMINSGIPGYLNPQHVTGLNQFPLKSGTWSKLESIFKTNFHFNPSQINRSEIIFLLLLRVYVRRGVWRSVYVWGFLTPLLEAFMFD